MTQAARAIDAGVIACEVCGLVCERPAADTHAACPRCGSALEARRPGSLGRATALLLAALVMYLPANLLPVMHTEQLGTALESTIMEGVIEFWEQGEIGIALIIFVASIAVPCMKFIALSTLYWTTWRGSHTALRERAKLYRIVELVGYWSMLDVLVVAIVCALVQFNALSSAVPRAGIFYFGLVVILTMLSAMQYDPRLMWDSKDENESDTAH